MPNAPKRLCRHYGCRELVESGLCAAHRRKRWVQEARERGTNKERHLGWRWTKVRNAFIRRNPLCVFCLVDGQLTPAEEVDHLWPRKIAPERAYDETNIQPVCQRHNAWKRDNIDKRLIAAQRMKA